MITIDFETYYDSDYSLRKMTTEQYIRDERFEVLMVAVKVGNHPVKVLPDKTFREWVKTVDWPNTPVLCHNVMFDGSILAWRYGVTPKIWLDTMSMAKPLHAKTCGVSLGALAKTYGIGEKGDALIPGKRIKDLTRDEAKRLIEYCGQDATLTHDLFKKLLPLIAREELRIIDVVLRMHTHPMLVIDKEPLERDLEEYYESKSRILSSLGFASEEQAAVELRSNAKFAAALEKMGVTVPTKVSPTTGKQTYALAKKDEDFQLLLEHDDPKVVALVEARLATKSSIRESRAKSFIGVADRGALPIHLNYYGAHTGRLSGGSGLNLQNLPRGSALRDAICAPDGYVLIGCDQAQIEARINMWFCGQDDVTQVFRNKRDVYCEFGEKIYGRKITKADKVERFLSKTAVLGLGFGMGADKFYDTVVTGTGDVPSDFDVSEAKRIVEVYRREHPKVVHRWRELDFGINAMIKGDTKEFGPVVMYNDYITLPNKRVIHYPLLQHDIVAKKFVFCNSSRLWRARQQSQNFALSADESDVAFTYGAKVLENIVQGLAAVVVSNQAAEIQKRYPVVLQVHDENIICVPEKEEKAARKFITEVMSRPPEWAPDLPLEVEVVSGRTYKELK